MQPQLEIIEIPENTASFNFFKLEVTGFPSFWHYHPEVELTYILQGRGLRFVGDHIAPFQSGDLVLVGENLPHNWVSGKKPDQVLEVAFVIQFPKSLFQNFPECKNIQQLVNDAQQGLFFPAPSRNLLDKVVRIKENAPIQRLAGLMEILSELATNTHHTLSSVTFNKRTGLKKHQHRISRVTAYILDHLEEPIPLEKMAEINGMTPPSFSRWFKQSMGKSFVVYLNTVRIEKACQYLLQTDLPVTQIAYGTGFESLSNFNRTFKRLKQVSPRDYRKAVSDPSLGEGAYRLQAP